MTIPTSGAITFEGDIVAEFGGSRSHSLGEYYRGGSNVPSNSTTQSIPTGGAIDFGDFYGASVTVNITNRTIASTGDFFPTASITFSLDGDASKYEDFVSTDLTNEWVSGPRNSSIGNRYKIRATATGYTGPQFFGPALGTFHVLSEDRTWSLEALNVGTLTTTLSITIQDTETSTTRDTATITLQSTRTDQGPFIA